MKARRLALTDADYRRAGRNIADSYFANLADIRTLAAARGITPIFFLQPNVYDVAAAERARAAYPCRLRRASGGRRTPARGRLPRHPRFAAFGVHDVTDALDGRAGEIFFDDCHVSRAGNQLLAARMRPYLPLAR